MRGCCSRATATADEVARVREAERPPTTTTTTRRQRCACCVPGEPELAEQHIDSEPCRTGKKLEWLNGSIGRREGRKLGEKRPPLIPAPLIRGERDKRRKFLSKSCSLGALVGTIFSPYFTTRLSPREENPSRAATKATT